MSCKAFIVIYECPKGLSILYSELLHKILGHAVANIDLFLQENGDIGEDPLALCEVGFKQFDEDDEIKLIS